MRKYLFLAVAIGIGLVAGLIIQPVISEDTAFNQVKKFDFVLNTAIKNYVDEVDTQKLVEAAIKGMLNELDPHSGYFSADEMKKVKEDFQGSFDGIGVEFDIINDTITIISPIPGGPSEALGIMAGDKIVKIDEKDAIGIDRNDVPKKLKGPKGTHVIVDIKRSSVPEILTFNITRDKIPIYSVDASYIIDGTDVGVVVVNRFSATTYEETINSLRELRSQGMKKLILDLRGNPGGYLNQAYYIAEEFIPNGDTIVFTRGRKPQFDENYVSSGRGEFQNIPMIVMINAGSASASEIVSGAIQDRDRGLVVGTTSYGKGLVQRQFDNTDGSAFRLTTSKYFTPSGRCIQRPYKDKDKYRNLMGRLDLEEGNYVNNTIENIKKHLAKSSKSGKTEDISIDSLPIYRTKSGRIVLGAGGITPDYIIKQDTITKLSIMIRSKNLFFEYVNNKLDMNSLKAKYSKNFSDFYRSYNVTDNMIDDFKKIVTAKDIKWNEDEYKTDEDFIKNTIKSTIARNIWNRNKANELFYLVDKQMQKAVELFPEAKKIAKIK
jgi:carboxyl-terminal processing protease